MLGFSPISSNPFSSLAGEVIRLESSALLDSLSIIDSSAFIRFFSSAANLGESALSLLSANVFNISSDIKVDTIVYPGTLIRIPNNSIFVNDSAVSAEYLSLIKGNSILDIDSKLVLNSYLSFTNSGIINGKSEVAPFGIIRLFPLANISKNFAMVSSPSIQLPSNSEFKLDSDLSSEILSRVIGNVNLTTVFDFNASQFVKSYINSNLEITSEISPIQSAKFFNSANFEIIAVLSGNISQVNRDIVYYIVYTDKIKPFNMYIARVK